MAYCSLCQDIISKALNDFDKNNLISIEVQRENEVQSHVDENIQIVQKSTPIQIFSPLNFLQITTRSNILISSLNTNAFIEVTTDSGSPALQVNPTYYFNRSLLLTDAFFGSPCYLKSSATPAGFYSSTNDIDSAYREFWPYMPPYFELNASATVDGFYGGCTPLDALLQSTLDCLYKLDCLQNFANYFPNWNSVCFISMMKLIFRENEFYLGNLNFDERSERVKSFQCDSERYFK